MIHLISYEVTNPTDCNFIAEAIKRLYLDCLRLQTSVWLIATDNEAVMVLEKLRVNLPENTYLFVTEMRDWASTEKLSPACTKWLDGHRDAFERKTQWII
jgi:hypothetical protein